MDARQSNSFAATPKLVVNKRTHQRDNADMLKLIRRPARRSGNALRCSVLLCVAGVASLPILWSLRPSEAPAASDDRVLGKLRFSQTNLAAPPQRNGHEAPTQGSTADASTLAQSPPELHCAASAPGQASAPFDMQLLHLEAPDTMPSDCANRMGNAWAKSIAESAATVCAPEDEQGSRVTRWRNGEGSTLYWMRDVVVDFSKARVVGGARRFDPGFVQARCSIQAGFSGIRSGDAGLQALQVVDRASGCDEMVRTPTVVAQHDDVGNTYHSLADLWRAWITLAVVQQPRCSAVTSPAQHTMCHPPDRASTFHAPLPARQCPAGHQLLFGVDPAATQLLNLDSRIMCNTHDLHGQPLPAPQPDCEGPYFEVYRRWFGRGIVPAHSFGSKRVCFSALGWAAELPANQIWSKFYEKSTCDLPSPVLRRYADYTLGRWGLLQTVPQACAPGAGTCVPFIRILYMVRNKKPFDAQPVRSRRIGNEPEFIAMLQRAGTARGATVEVDAADFATMHMTEQLKHARAAHVLVGMHGAGMVYSLYMGPRDSCGGQVGVVELLPKDFGSVFGIQHIASFGGARYWRWVGAEASNNGPTQVDLPAVEALLREAIAHVLDTRQATCGAVRR